MNARTSDHPVHDQFLNRWSPRAFDGTAMTEADVLAGQLINRANKIRVNKDLIGKDRATGLLTDDTRPRASWP